MERLFFGVSMIAPPVAVYANDADKRSPHHTSYMMNTHSYCRLKQKMTWMTGSRLDNPFKSNNKRMIGKGSLKEDGNPSKGSSNVEAKFYC